MRAPQVLVGLALLLASGLAPVHAAAAPMCQGEEATIVGEGVLTGTDGPDVIVGLERAEIEALGGDDKICVGWGEVDAGAGHDSVTIDVSLGNRLTLNLGPGDDHFVDSGSSDDDVDLRSLGGDSTGQDVIDTGNGRDSVGTGVRGVPNHDVVELGNGNDFASVVLESGSGVHVSGEGDRDQISTSGPLVDDAVWAVTLGGTVQRGAETLATLPGFTDHSLDFGSDVKVRVIGSRLADRISLNAGEFLVDLAAGKDLIHVHQGLKPLETSGVLRTGRGEDALIVETATSIELDLSHGTLLAEGTTFEIAGLERLGVKARKVKVVGDDRANYVEAAGCRVRMAGGRGDDELRDGWEDGLVQPMDCRSRFKLLGQAGDDVLVGSRHKDVLRGGRGHDSANGLQGIDTCRAEEKKKCER